MSRIDNLGRILAAAILLAAVGAGCGGDKNSLGPSGTTAAPSGTSGVLSVQLQTAGSPQVQDCRDDSGRWVPPDSSKLITSLELTFDTIRIYPARADSGENRPAEHGRRCDPDSGAEFIDILSGPISVDATRLADTLTTTLNSFNVPAGSYSHLGLRISSASAVTADGQTVVVHVLTGDSLVKILVPFTVVEGQTTEIHITLDLNRAVREVPFGSGQFYLDPVLAGQGRGPHEGGPFGWGPGGRPGHGGHGGGPGGDDGGGPGHRHGGGGA